VIPAERYRSARFGPYIVSHIQHGANKVWFPADNFGHPWRAVRLIFVLDGQITLQAKERTAVVGPRCAALTVGWQPLGFETAGARVIEVDFAIERAQTGCSFEEDSLIIWQPETALPSATCAALRELLTQPGATDTVRTETTRVVDQLITSVVSFRPKPAPINEYGLADRESVLAYLRDNHTNRDLSLIRIANHFSVSTRTLHRLFEDDTQTICSHLAQERLNTALTRLKDSAWASSNLEEIAEQSGYASSMALRRAVLAATNKTPSEFRSFELTNSVAG
jgi:AraC-like DNA-binding protein